MIMRGATLVDVKELLGHTDIKMTMRHAHLSPGHRRAAVDKLVDNAPLTPRFWHNGGTKAVESGVVRA